VANSHLRACGVNDLSVGKIIARYGLNAPCSFQALAFSDRHGAMTDRFSTGTGTSTAVSGLTILNL
jgi:hypothetical protein